MRSFSLAPLMALVVVACGSEPESHALPVDDAVDEPVIVELAPVDPRGSDAVDVEAGRALFEHAWVKNDPRARGGDGLGPHYNASSCVACHAQGGAGGSGANHNNVVIGDGRVLHRHGGWLPAPPARGLTGRGIGSLLVGTFAGVVAPPSRTSDMRIGTPVILGSLDKEMVRRVVTRVRSQLQHCYARTLATSPGASGKVTVKWVIDATGSVPQASVAVTTMNNVNVESCLVAVHKRMRFPSPKGGGIVVVTQPYVFSTGRAPPPAPPPPTVRVERNTPALFGAGLIDDIPDEVIEASAQTSHARHPEITGKVGRTPDGRVARFGWKGDVPDLVTFVSRACSVELGLEVPGSPQPGRAVDGYDIDLDDLEDLITFVRELPQPMEKRADGDNQVASEGAEIFDAIGCTACHTPALGDVDGLYSDLLLHDMGNDLGDLANAGYYGSPSVSGSNEWRTPPLWGARDSAPYLHDGRARTLERAIALHGGEAWRVRSAYNQLGDADRAAVIAFLESLQAPAPATRTDG